VVGLVGPRTRPPPRRTPDISQFREKQLIDLIEEMAEGQMVSREALLEVAHPNNHIAGIKEAILRDTGATLYRKAYPRQRRVKRPR
jgi:hypothetical protein